MSVDRFVIEAFIYEWLIVWSCIVIFLVSWCMIAEWWQERKMVRLRKTWAPVKSNPPYKEDK